MITSALGSEIQSGLLELESDLYVDAEDVGTPWFLWKGARVNCIPSMALRGSVVITGGHEAQVAVTLNVRREYFLTVDSTLITVDTELFTADNDMPAPVAGRFLKHGARDYRILSAALDPTGVYFSLVLGDKQSGR